MTEYAAARTDNRFSQIPHWVTEAPISDGAYRLYGVLMKYAHYQTRDAYPSRATLARDVALLKERGYALKNAMAADLFPRCSHVESIVTLVNTDMEEHS